MKTLAVVFAFAVAFTMVSFAAEPAKGRIEAQNITPAAQGRVIDMRNKLCPVTGYTADPNVTVEYSERRIRLFNEYCIAHFYNQPEKCLGIVELAERIAAAAREPVLPPGEASFILVSE